MQSLNISTSAMRGIQQALDNTANNLANIDSAGYQRRVASFSELLSDSMNEQPAEDNVNRNSPKGIRIGSGAHLGMSKLDLSPGAVKVTDVPTDLMIEGDGYFAVSRRTMINGNLEEKFYFTRDGNFKLSEYGTDPNNKEFVLTNSNGDFLIGDNGEPITIPDPTKPFTINSDGGIVVGDNPNPINTIQVWKVNNPDQLEQVGKNLFDAELDTAIKPDGKYVNAINEGIAKIRQGALEGSNVSMTEEMSQLVNIQRAYQLNSRAIGISDQMMGIANQLRSR
ncbi:flagellar hook-basal body protein [Brevibacillus formosus]|uniref:flagellar hook-basal body protein n=1 Tax=Brevibacillus TaxID=55080 RepID=UPI000D1136D8|nr:MULTISPECIES: flagellar hook-basal body protein [Brevibacillus]MBG9942240.1 flagellar hook-basal body protein [Brevibacillus formosus]MED1944737.1 flagellar hook-basal body protein [Brevibacillus formosus]MED1996576.1 flagellar hook-basal body protein [Brevibacillus formosus]MED2081545.1 flagellar hook-basal body protein [Brevibacillus formosus]PSK19945.1 flagellar hook-basal body protein [Brevibacillus sp. NRRL NRS-603]